MADYSKLTKKELIMTLYARDLMLENERKRLRDLPKKIVEEIIEELCNCGKTYLEDEPYIEICIVKGILDAILEKFGDKNEINND